MRRRLRGLKALVHDAVDGVVDLVREGHESTARTVMRVTDRVEPIAAPARAVNVVRRVSTAGVLGTVKLVNRAVEVASDAGIDLAIRVTRDGEVRRGRDASDASSAEAAPRLEPAVVLRSDVMVTPGVALDAALGLVNAVLGDHLHRRANGLSMGMVLRAREHYVDPTDEASLAPSLAASFALASAAPAPGPRVAVFVHGLGTTEWSWVLEAAAYHGDPTATFASLLERDLGVTPVFVRYNTGRHVSTNGRALAAALAALVRAYPVPIEELILVGHSMGGLVIRSACHYASGADDSEKEAPQAGADWVRLVRRVFCLGSPHQGAPLEKFGNLLTGVLGAIDLPGTLIPARILERRSAGIKDLRHGALVDEDWLGRDPDALRDEGRQEVPLLPGVTYHFVSATITRDPEHPLGELVGDLLVRVPSSSGPVVSRHGTFAIETKRFGGVMHHQLQNHPAVYEVVRRGCDPASVPRVEPPPRA